MRTRSYSQPWGCAVPYTPRPVAPQVARSFDTWAANHKKIYFTDVTAQCTNATDNVCAAAEVCVSTPRCPMYRLQTHQTLLTTTY